MSKQQDMYFKAAVTIIFINKTKYKNGNSRTENRLSEIKKLLDGFNC